MDRIQSILVAVLLLPLSALANIITDTQSITSGGSGSVAYTQFSQDATATTTIQTFTNSFDPQMYLFFDDGSLDSSDFIAVDDDSGVPSAYGFSNALLSLILNAGNYIVAVSDYYLNVDDAVSGINTNITSLGVGYGSYDLQIASDANILLTAVPEPGTIALFSLGLLGLSFSRRVSPTV
jgi:hypothetical protein